MQQSMEKRILYAARLICVLLIVQWLYSILGVKIISAIAISYDISVELYNNIVNVIMRQLFSFLNVIIFGIFAWIIRQKKRLSIPLLFYIILHMVTVVFPKMVQITMTNMFGTIIIPPIPIVFHVLLLAAIIVFYTAFLRHPKLSLRIAAILAIIGAVWGALYPLIVSVIALLRAPLNSNAGNVALSGMFYINVLISAFVIVFWVMLSMTLSQKRKITEP